VTIGDGVTYISSLLYYLGDSLTTINVSGGNPIYSSIDGVLFSKEKDTLLYCPKGRTQVTIPSSVVSIGNGAFSHSYPYNASKLTKIEVDAGNPAYSSVDGVLFNKDTTILLQYPVGKQGEYSIPPGVVSIGDRAFTGCGGLTSVTIPDGFTSIWDYAFAYCSGLKSVTIPNSVTSVGDWAFSNC
jgi:hypothetical protein